MEKNPANNSGQQDGSGKNKNKKKNRQTGSKDQHPQGSGNDFPPMSSQSTTQQKQQQPKEKKPANDFPQIEHQKQQQPKEPKQIKGSDNSQKQQPQNKNCSQILPNVTQQKQQQPKATKIPEKQYNKGDQTASYKPRVQEKMQMKPTGNQQIDQQIEILRNKLVIPKRKNPKVGGKLGRPTELDVNHLPLNLDKLFKKTVFHIDCQFTPELPKRLLRTALEQFAEKHYKGTHFAFDGRRNMYTTKELKGRTDLVTVLNEENGRSMDFTIVTSVVNQINMGKIEEYLKTGSSNVLLEKPFKH